MRTMDISSPFIFITGTSTTNMINKISSAPLILFIMFVVVVRLSSNRMQTSGAIVIFSVSTRYRFRCCLVAIRHRINDCSAVCKCSSCTKLVYLRNLLNSLCRTLGGHDCSFEIFGGARALVPPMFYSLCRRSSKQLG